MPQDQPDSQSSSTDQSNNDLPTDPQGDHPSQPDAQRARPPRGYDDPLRRERNSGLVPSDGDVEQR